MLTTMTSVSCKIMTVANHRTVKGGIVRAEMQGGWVGGEASQVVVIRGGVMKV
jgi:hypothetical protein